MKNCFKISWKKFGQSSFNILCVIVELIFCAAIKLKKFKKSDVAILFSFIKTYTFKQWDPNIRLVRY